jgi:hypothetical protein
MDLELDRYLLTACSLMLMVALVAGSAGYAGIRNCLSASTTTAKVAPLEQVSRQPAPISNRHGVTAYAE